MRFFMRFLLSIFALLIFSVSATIAQDKAVTLEGDKKYGECFGSKILADFFKRYPPKNTAEFSLEIDLNKTTDEIFVYYDNMPAYEGDVSYYDAQTCLYLRTENDRVSASDGND